MSAAQPNPTTGLLLGKFMPPHRGHQYLIDFSRHYVNRLAIVMDSLPDQPIPGNLRLGWLREMFPNQEIFHLTGQPQDPAEHPDFWDIWRYSLQEVLPFQPDFVFASENYGWKLAGVLGARFVPVDIDRGILPVSGTAIRRDPFGHWQYLPRCVRPYFVKRICIFGPESTGKSTLTRQLAERFQTVFVPEYARTHLEFRGGEIAPNDMNFIARGQAASEDAIAPSANRLLFCDTDLILTTIWSQRLFDACPDWIRAEADRREYDLYLLTDVDVPWVADTVRYLPDEGQEFFERCVHELESRNRHFVRIHGNWNRRFRLAVAAVNELLT